VDQSQRRVVNTIKITFDKDRAEANGDEFWVPFRVPNTYYSVTHPDKERWGNPHLLNLRDFTGDGIAAEFPLFIYDACGIASGSVFGYSTRSDEAVQYPVLVVETGEQPRIEQWIMQVFSRKPASPGHWRFTWRIGHGSEDIYDEDVTFDRIKQFFIEKQTIRQPK
jgi:hypothetical protein